TKDTRLVSSFCDRRGPPQNERVLPRAPIIVRPNADDLETVGPVQVLRRLIRLADFEEDRQRAAIGQLGQSDVEQPPPDAMPANLRQHREIQDLTLSGDRPSEEVSCNAIVSVGIDG